MEQHPRQREWYLRNKEAVKARSVESRKRYTERNRNFVQDYLSEHPCIDCGEKDIEVLDFHHTSDDKESTISILVHRPASLKTIQKEIDKCVVVCANDHRRRHHRGRFGFDVELEG